uniref:(northern house mosquito) hypothetical protein n=1 Tax=Culex pipiens TaxID=7175 RepID=A0A8D8GDJ5_CULPI
MPFLSPEGWLLSKLKFKLNWFTLAKILLKIVIFKKIVKFIALLCLLFFIPTLKPSESDSDSGEGERGDDYRRRSYDLKYDYDHRLKEVTRFALKAMEAFTIDNEIYCPEENLLSCRAKRMFDVIDEEYPLQSVLRMFVPYSKSVQTAFRMQAKKEDHVNDDDDHNGNSIDQTSSTAASSNEGVERDD